jgi:rhamnosyltransferase
MTKMTKGTPKVSIIIRTRNEAKQLDALLCQFAEQANVPSYEILLIDNESRDNIEAVAKKHRARLFKIADGDFTYPKAWNIAVPHSKGEFLVFISAHAKLIGNQYFNHMFNAYSDDNVAGVYGTNLPMLDAPISEKILYRFGYFIHRAGKTKKITEAKPGVFGTSNATARGDLMRGNPFDETFAGGGEDQEWAKAMLEQGYSFIRLSEMAVHHSHYLTDINQLKQHRYWFALDKPVKFDRKKINGYRSSKY